MAPGKILLCILREMHNIEIYSERGFYYNNFRTIPGLYNIGHAVFYAGHRITINQVIPLCDKGYYYLRPTPYEISSALRCRDSNSKSSICPHLRTSSPELFDSKLPPAKYPDHTWRERRTGYDYRPCDWAPMWDNLREGECGSRAKCPAPDCATRYALYRIWGGVVLAVIRDLLSDPTHPSWLAQCVPESMKKKSGAETDERRSGAEAGKGERELHRVYRVVSCKGKMCCRPTKATT
jgi:hypothetical protein